MSHFWGNAYIFMKYRIYVGAENTRAMLTAVFLYAIVMNGRNPRLKCVIEEKICITRKR